jgi:hypothetical protein
MEDAKTVGDVVRQGLPCSDCPFYNDCHFECEKVEVSNE